MEAQTVPFVAPFLLTQGSWHQQLLASAYWLLQRASVKKNKTYLLNICKASSYCMCVQSSNKTHHELQNTPFKSRPLWDSLLVRDSSQPFLVSHHVFSRSDHVPLVNKDFDLSKAEILPELKTDFHTAKWGNA